MTRASTAVLAAVWTISLIAAVGLLGPARPDPAAAADKPAQAASPGRPKAKIGPKAKTKPKPPTARVPRAPGYDRLMKTYQMAPGSLGFLAIDADSGRVLAALEPDQLFIPASSIKAATAVAALNILGGTYRFETSVHTKGSVKDGVLYGDVILRGGGDPVLTTEDLTPLIAALKSRGIKSVKGRLLYDDTMFPSQRAIERGEDEEMSYNPGVGPLSLNFNRIRLRWVMRGKNAPFVQVLSKTDKMELPVDFIDAAIAPTGVRTRYGVAYDNGTNPPKWLLTRGARGRGEMWLPVKRPALHAIDVFRKLAAQAGLALPAPARGKLPPDAVFVAKSRSKPLPVILREILKYSNNMAAELTGMVAANKLTGKPLGVTPSALALAQWYKQTRPQGNWNGILLENHSGLSTRSRITPRQLVAILRYAQRQNFAGYTLESLLRPYWIAGRRNSRAMSMSTVFEGKRKSRGPVITVPRHVVVHAKTGTLSWSRALAGYLTTVRKKNVIFAVFVSDYRAREVADKEGRKHKSLSRGRWAWRSRALMRAVVLKWALEN